MRFPCFGRLLFALLLVVISPREVVAASSAIPLPPPAKWDSDSLDAREVDDGVELIVPINYKIGRLISPAVDARPGELFTVAADVASWFDSKQQTYYRCWLELEFFSGEKVVASFVSPELTGSQDERQLLAVTGTAPAETTSVRAVLCAQNKFWSIVDNRCSMRNVRLLSLGNPAQQGELRIRVAAELPKRAGAREATLQVQGDWPDGSALELTSDRGGTPRSVLLIDGTAEVPLRFQPEEVGSSEITARIGEQKAMVRVADPQAATLSIGQVMADGMTTPALVQLTREGKMLPGRYQQTVPGIFVAPPWTVDLAPGKWVLRVCRGPRFKAEERTIEATSGETIHFDRIELDPVVDLPASGWFAGDPDGDVYHGEKIYTDVSAQTASDIGQAMGLDWLAVGSWNSEGLGTPYPKTWGEARLAMKELGRGRFRFMWTDERPKSGEGHACFVGLSRPDEDRFGWGWATNGSFDLRNHEWLGLIRASGGATFANHPLRWWVSGTKFRTNMASSLPFDLCAAGLLDGVNINDKLENLALWSMLLDHGYQVAATAGADFCLDRPGGPPPGVHRMYCYCPEGISSESLAEAVRQGRTIVSTGPTLLVDAAGRPPGARLAMGKTHKIAIKAWARGDQSDELARVELWSRGKTISTRSFPKGTELADEVMEWTPEGKRDWVAVRVVSRGGWAMSSAFYAGEGWRPREAVTCELALNVTGLGSSERAGAVIEVWDNAPHLITSKRIRKIPLEEAMRLEVPVTATVVVTTPGGKQREVSVYEATGVHEVVEQIASGAKREQPLLDWATYDEVLKRCQKATATVSF